MMTDFKPGDEVVCVDASTRPGRRWFPGSAPEQGATYTVKTVEVRKRRFTDDEGDEVVCLVLVELRNYAPNGSEGYRASRFRKAQKRNSSLSIESFLTIKPGFEEPKKPVNQPGKVKA